MDYSEYRLLRGSGADTVFTRLPKPQPGPANTTPESGDATKLLLVGGFQTVRHYRSMAVSSALQLNGDLARFDDTRLKHFAVAELGKMKQTSFNSYTVEPQRLLCVLSDDRSKLEAFTDTYGGVLDVESLLLNRIDPAYDTITELSISNQEGKYLIDYSVRSPIDYQRCSYCGACGISCPEQCISELLFFDYSKCTFCRDCEKNCPHDAIDINTIEKRALIVPAIIVLGTPSIELPESADKIFREDQVTQYLASLFPYRVDEIISIDHSICQHDSAGTGKGCNKCLDVCPSGAIIFSDKLKIDHHVCLDCGKCAGTCPTGALQYQKLPDKAFMEFFRDFPLSPGTAIVIGTAEDLHRLWWRSLGESFENHLFFEYPNIGALSFFHFIFLIAHGAGNVIILNCNEPGPTLKKAIENTNRLLKVLFDSPERVLVCSGKNTPPLPKLTSRQPLTERPYTSLNYINRKNKTADILQYLTSCCSTVKTIAAGEIEDLGAISCNRDACTQCLACLNVCKIEALTADSSALELRWQGSLCIGCGLCISICPETALSRGPSILLDTSYFTKTTIAKAEPMKCRECGKVFGTRKSFEHVMKVLAAKNKDKDGFFDYCEDCRVLKLLESE